MDSMKTITIVTPFLSGFGGTEQVIRTLLRNVSNKDVEQKQFLFKLALLGGTLDKNWTNETNTKFFNLKLPKAFRKIEYLFRLPYWCYKLLRESNDIFVCTNPYIWTILWLLKTVQRKNILVVAWYHFSLVQKPINALLLRASDKYLAISSGIKRELIRRGISQEDIGLVFNPVNTTISESLIDSPKKAFLDLIYIGRFDYSGQKNVSEIFLALSKVKTAYRLRIYGQGKDQAKLEKLANHLSIAGEINFEGFSSNVWSEVKYADALLLSSKFEGLPLVLIESIAHGVPVISSNCPTGPEDIVDDTKNGFLYDMGQINQFAECIENIKQIRAAYTPKEIAATVRQFDADRYAERFISLMGRWTDSNVE
ncbi:hypothetical protein DA801_04465 [Lacticaseibacillus rhamnosus]|nr:hypothetical protein DA801_04465 [Lacticaseibacillus rhamnosus]